MASVMTTRHDLDHSSHVNGSSTATIRLAGPLKLPDGIVLQLKTLNQMVALENRLRQSTEKENCLVYLEF